MQACLAYVNFEGFCKKDKEIDFEGRCFIVDFFFCRNIAKMHVDFFAVAYAL